MPIEIQSSAFSDHQAIPRRHTGDDEDASPPLAWSGLPDGTQELALVVDDPDAPSPQPWIHWVIYGIPASHAGLKAALPKGSSLPDPAGAMQGKNSWGAPGYRGPAPPRGHGVHHYHFKLYALDAKLGLKPGAEKHELQSAMKGHVLAEGELVGTYQR